jgi:ribosomal protein L11 methyltransferase
MPDSNRQDEEIRWAWISELWPGASPPIEIGDVVITSAASVPVPHTARFLIKLNAGRCFGLGNHPTTQLCIHALADADLAGLRVLDFGTGSGILGIYASKRGAAFVIEVDSDRQCFEFADANVRLNRLAGQVGVMQGSIKAAARYGPYDVIMANILWQDLQLLLPALIGMLNRPGELILSGIHATEETLFYEVVENMHPNLIVPAGKDDWRCCSILLTDYSIGGRHEAR